MWLADNIQSGQTVRLSSKTLAADHNANFFLAFSTTVLTLAIVVSFHLSYAYGDPIGHAIQTTDDLKAKLKHITADVLQFIRLGFRVHRSHEPNVDILGFSDC